MYVHDRCSISAASFLDDGIFPTGPEATTCLRRRRSSRTDSFRKTRNTELEVRKLPMKFFDIRRRGEDRPSKNLESGKPTLKSNVETERGTTGAHTSPICIYKYIHTYIYAYVYIVVQGANAVSPFLNSSRQKSRELRKKATSNERASERERKRERAESIFITYYTYIIYI